MRTCSSTKTDSPRCSARRRRGCWRLLVRRRRRSSAGPSQTPTRVLSQASEQANTMRSDAMTEAVRHRERAESAAMAEVEAAKVHGRQLITDAEALRERVLADLARRRNVGRAQVEQLREGRDRLLGVYEVVQRTIDHAVEALRVSAPDAHAVAARERRRASRGCRGRGGHWDRRGADRRRARAHAARATGARARGGDRSRRVTKSTVVEEWSSEIVTESSRLSESPRRRPSWPVTRRSTKPSTSSSRDPSRPCGRSRQRRRSARRTRDRDPHRFSWRWRGLRNNLDAKETSEDDGRRCVRAARRRRWRRSRRPSPASCAGCSRTTRTRCSTGCGRAASCLTSMPWSAAPEEHAARYAGPARSDLDGAARAGGETVGGVPLAEPADLDDVVTDLGERGEWSAPRTARRVPRGQRRRHRRSDRARAGRVPRVEDPENRRRCSRRTPSRVQPRCVRCCAGRMHVAVARGTRPTSMPRCRRQRACGRCRARHRLPDRTCARTRASWLPMPGGDHPPLGSPSDACPQ